MVPQLSYTIWFSQRTGSSLLCNALESTGVAGKPNEWLIHKPDLLEDFAIFQIARQVSIIEQRSGKMPFPTIATFS